MSDEKPPKSDFELECEAKAATFHRIKRMAKIGNAMTVDELEMLCNYLNVVLAEKHAGGA